MRVIYVEKKKTKKPEYLSPVVNAHFLVQIKAFTATLLL